MKLHSINYGNLLGPGARGSDDLRCHIAGASVPYLSTQMCYRFCKALKSMRIRNLAQLRVAICPLAVLSAKGSELWGRYCNGAR